MLPFKLAATDESLTAQSGLALFGEYLRAMDVCGLIDRELPGPDSVAGSPSVHVLPLVLMLADGGWTLEDLRVLRGDEGLRSLLRLDEMPSSDATGDWLRRMGAGKGKANCSAGLERVNRSVLRPPRSGSGPPARPSLPRPSAASSLSRDHGAARRRAHQPAKSSGQAGRFY
jgi:hypothetical protein